VLAEFWQVVLEDLLEELHDLSHLWLVEAIEGHYGELGNHVAECDEGLMFIHVEEEDSCHIGHPLDIAYIWPMHGEGLKDSLETLIMLASWLEYF
jgi:hypothetical protein